MKIKTVRKYVTSKYTINALAHHVRYRARTRFGTYPIDYQWSLNEKILVDEGVIEIDETEIKYKVNKNICDLWTKSGESVTTKLYLRALDARGREYVSYVPLKLMGSEKIGGRPKRRTKITGADFILRYDRRIKRDPRIPELPTLQGKINPKEEFRKALERGMKVKIKEKEMR